MLTTTLTGDWDRLTKKLNSLPSDIAKARETGLRRAGEETVQTIQGHLSRQDLPWTPLSESTIKQKGNNNILVESGALASSIQVNDVSQDSVFIGANPSATYPSGEKVSEVLKYHEFGTETEPPRPLVRPSFNEVKPKVQDLIKEEISNAIKK